MSVTLARIREWLQKNALVFWIAPLIFVLLSPWLETVIVVDQLPPGAAVPVYWSYHAISLNGGLAKSERVETRYVIFPASLASLSIFLAIKKDGVTVFKELRLAFLPYLWLMVNAMVWAWLHWLTQRGQRLLAKDS